MIVRCCIVGCPTAVPESEIHKLFAFPRMGTEEYQRWLEACSEVCIRRSRNLLICPLHFSGYDEGPVTTIDYGDLPSHNLTEWELQTIRTQMDKINKLTYEWLTLMVEKNAKYSITLDQLISKAQALAAILELDGFNLNLGWAYCFKDLLFNLKLEHLILHVEGWDAQVYGIGDPARLSEESNPVAAMTEARSDPPSNPPPAEEPKDKLQELLDLSGISSESPPPQLDYLPPWFIPEYPALTQEAMHRLDTHSMWVVGGVERPIPYLGPPTTIGEQSTPNYDSEISTWRSQKVFNVVSGGAENQPPPPKSSQKMVTYGTQNLMQTSAELEENPAPGAFVAWTVGESSQIATGEVGEMEPAPQISVSSDAFTTWTVAETIQSAHTYRVTDQELMEQIEAAIEASEQINLDASVLSGEAHSQPIPTERRQLPPIPNLEQLSVRLSGLYKQWSYEQMVRHSKPEKVPDREDQVPREEPEEANVEVAVESLSPLPDPSKIWFEDNETDAQYRRRLHRRHFEAFMRPIVEPESPPPVTTCCTHRLLIEEAPEFIEPVQPAIPVEVQMQQRIQAHDKATQIPGSPTERARDAFGNYVLEPTSSSDGATPTMLQSPNRDEQTRRALRFPYCGAQEPYRSCIHEGRRHATDPDNDIDKEPKAKIPRYEAEARSIEATTSIAPPVSSPPPSIPPAPSANWPSEESLDSEIREILSNPNPSSSRNYEQDSEEQARKADVNEVDAAISNIQAMIQAALKPSSKIKRILPSQSVIEAYEEATKMLREEEEDTFQTVHSYIKKVDGDEPSPIGQPIIQAYYDRLVSVPAVPLGASTSQQALRYYSMFERAREAAESVTSGELTDESGAGRAQARIQTEGRVGPGFQDYREIKYEVESICSTTESADLGQQEHVLELFPIADVSQSALEMEPLPTMDMSRLTLQSHASEDSHMMIQMWPQMIEQEPQPSVFQHMTHTFVQSQPPSFQAMPQPMIPTTAIQAIQHALTRLRPPTIEGRSQPTMQPLETQAVAQPPYIEGMPQPTMQPLETQAIEQPFAQMQPTPIEGMPQQMMQETQAITQEFTQMPPPPIQGMTQPMMQPLYMQPHSSFAWSPPMMQQPQTTVEELETIHSPIDAVRLIMIVENFIYQMGYVELGDRIRELRIIMCDLFEGQF